MKVQTVDTAADPMEVLDDVLASAWESVCGHYDVIVQRPSITELFAGARLSDPDGAAQTVLVNILGCMIECVDRFSPWYIKPAKAYGLELVANRAAGRSTWQLTRAARQSWRMELAALTAAIAACGGVLEAALLVDDLISRYEGEEDCVLVACACRSPRVIRVWRSVLARRDITCEACQQPFRPS